MNIWLLKDGENLPVQENASRMRMWLLADALSDAGHQVTWWSSTHSHQRKQLLYDHDQKVAINDRFTLMLLHAGSYERNRSIRRLLHHSRLARRFLDEAPLADRPDIIVVAFPILDLLNAALKFGRKSGVPVVVDVRDPWPDAIVNSMPGWFEHLARPFVALAHRRIARSMDHCVSIVACSKGFLDWALRVSGREVCKADCVFHLGRPGGSQKDAQALVGSSAIRERYGVPEDATLFAFVGSFGHVYDLETVCKATETAARLPDSRVHTVLVGDGLKYEPIRRQYRQLKNLTMTGWLGSSDVGQILDASDVGLAPCQQLAGCVPNKISEYTSAGLPILSSLKGDMMGLLEHYGAGFSYEAGDSEKLSELMVRLAADPSLIAGQRAGSEKMFAEEFNSDEIYPKFVRHIESMADQTAASRVG